MAKASEARNDRGHRSSKAPAIEALSRNLPHTRRRGNANYEAVTAIAEIIPNVNAGRHTHPGPETGYVLDGELTLLVEGKPPQTLKPGNSYQVPAVAIHDARSGEKGGKVFAAYVVEKGKPLASPAP